MHRPTPAAQLATQAIDNARKQRCSGTTSSQGSQSRGTRQIHEPIPEHWVDKLFARLAAIYGHRFQSTYPDAKALTLAKREWAQALGRVAPERIASAMDKLVESATPWPPSLPEFIALCRVSAEDLGAPSAAEAWRIACHARGKPGTLQQRYRHPLVLAAINHPDCDLFAWSQLPEREGLARFRPVYERLLAQAANGDEFAWPESREAIEDRTSKAVTPREQAEARYQAKRTVRAIRARLSGTSPVTDWQRVHGMRRYM